MNDAYYEQLVARRSKPTDMVIRILVILVIAAVAFFGTPFIGSFAILLAAALAVLAYYFIFSKLNVEYEYVLLNHDMDVDVIYNQSKRKRRLSFDLNQAEIMAPTGSPRLHSYKPQQTYDFSSGDANTKSYSLFLSVDQKLTCIKLEPDEEMFRHMQGWMGMKLYRD